VVLERYSEEFQQGTEEYRQLYLLEGVYGNSFLDDDMGPVVMHTGCECFSTVTRCDFSESLNVRYSSA
jgi:hypothetical protein